MNIVETALTEAQVRTAEALFGLSLGVSLGKRSGDVKRVMYPAMGEWHRDSVLRVFEYGAQRFVNDRVGGSDTDVTAKAAEAAKVMEKIVSGDWARARGEGVDAATEIRRTIIGGLVRAQVGKVAWADEWKDADDLDAKLDNVYGGQDADAQTAIDAEVAAELARRAAKAKGIAGLKAGLKLSAETVEGDDDTDETSE